MDQPPCPVDVHLREFALDPTLRRESLEEYVDQVAREMVTMRRIRHPSVACVIGHFFTGGSLVQVSDWFGGRPLEERWDAVRDSTVSQRLGLCYRLVQALAFCHERGIFHRNICADAVLVSDDLEDLKLTSFEYARDLERSGTLTGDRLWIREPRLIPPEDLTHPTANPRTGDAYQLGLLFYRIMEGGAWPFEDPVLYASGDCPLRPFHLVPDADGGSELRTLLQEMLSPRAEKRPDPLQRVEGALHRIAST